MVSLGQEGARPQPGGARERRKRTVYTKTQVDVLKRVFQNHPYPSFRVRDRLAQLLGIEEPRIHVWFQNRRARQPKKTDKSANAQTSQRVPAGNLPKETFNPDPATSSLVPGTNGNPSYWYYSGQYWDCEHNGSFHSQSSSFGTGYNIPIPQTNLVASGMSGEQPSQQPFTSCTMNVQLDMNYFDTQQPGSWSQENLQSEEELLNLQCPLSQGMAYDTNYLNYN